uniref:Trehalase n=1 Tax=Caenorhabditis tropicalis TaxID=1561998 RepID=A0A1I7V3P5_9PELO
MHDTTKGIIENFSSLVATLGYIPNSGNLQLTRRSQPPLFPHMVWEYTKSTGIYDRKWFESMETEMKFWETNRSISFDNHQLFVYRTLSNCPRPENFLGDYNMGMRTPNPSSVWRAISSACESGWDFSSRWMDQNSTADLSSIHTDRIIPVDLNTIIANNYRYMASYSDHFGLFDKSARYREKFEKLKEAIQSVLWDEGAGAWFDYDLTTQKKNLNFYPSNVYPLLIPGFETHADRVADYMKVSGALNYTGGIPSSLLAHSTQQWDYPNVWAPNQHFLVQSFLSSNNSFLRDIARRQMESFIDTVHNGLYNPMKGFDEGIWEKYDGRSRIGAPGRGGEYVAQEGFGWTNGAVLDFIWILNQYQERSDRSQPVQLNNTQQSSLIYAVVGFCVLLAIIMVFKGIIRPKSMQQLDEAGALLLGDEDDQDEL